MLPEAGTDRSPVLPSGLVESIPLHVDAKNNFYQTMISANAEAIAMVREVDGWSIPRRPEEWGALWTLSISGGLVS